MVHIYSTDEWINQFAIGYMINPSLHINKLFRQQVEKFLNATFHEKTMVTIIYVMKNKDTCVIALIFFYEKKVTKPNNYIGCWVVPFLISYTIMFLLTIYRVNQKH